MEAFNRSELSLKPLAERRSKLSISRIRKLRAPRRGLEGLVGRTATDASNHLAQDIIRSRDGSSKVILFMGAHLIKLGLTRFVTDLILKGYIDHVAMNGACAVHDFELNTHGGTSEDVKRYIAKGQFGLWSDTSSLNSVINNRPSDCKGAGNAFAQHLHTKVGASPETSIFAACHEAGIPATLHILMGGDINHSHPNFDGAAWGSASYHDFLVFAESLRGLHNGGVFLNVGSAVHGPEIFLKALSMVRNVGQCKRFTTGVLDLYELPKKWRDGEANPNSPLYYFRPWKTLLLRTQDDGHSEYVQGDFTRTIPLLWRHIKDG